MGKSKKSFRPNFAPFLAGIVLFHSPGFAHSATWDYGVNIDLGAIYTDNVFLDPDGLEQSESVYTIAPEFYLTSTGDRIDLDFRYRPEAFFYRTFDEADSVYHVVDASMTSTLIREKFYLDLGVANFQSIVLPIGQFPTSNIPITENRVDSRELNVRPYWEQSIGSADLLVEVDYIDTHYDDELIQDFTIKQGRFELDNIDRQQGFAWGAYYDNILSEYEDALPWEYERVELNLGYWVAGTVRVFGSGGAESDFSTTLESNLDADFWEGGFQYRPSQRLNFEIAAGERFYGSSFRLNFDYTSRRGSTSFSYDESPRTRSLVSSGRSPINDTDNLDGIIDSPLSSDQFISKRLDWFTSIALPKSEFTLRLFGEKRELRATDDGTPLDDEDYSGIALRWSWNIGVNTILGVGGDFSQRSALQQDDELRRLYTDLTIRLSQRLSIRGEVIHSTQNGRETNLFDYNENQYRILLRTEI